MNRLYVFAALMFIVPIVAFAQVTDEPTAKQRAAASRARDLKDIESLEIEWNRINEQSDPEGKRRLLADDSYHVGPSGRLYTKEQDIAAAQATEEQNRKSDSTLRFTITDKRIRLYKGVAVVTAFGTSVRTTDGQKKSRRILPCRPCLGKARRPLAPHRRPSNGHR